MKWHLLFVLTFIVFDLRAEQIESSTNGEMEGILNELAEIEDNGEDDEDENEGDKIKQFRDGTRSSWQETNLENAAKEGVSLEGAKKKDKNNGVLNNFVEQCQKEKEEKMRIVRLLEKKRKNEPKASEQTGAPPSLCMQHVGTNQVNCPNHRKRMRNHSELEDSED
jgi:hypothetical protein